MNKTSDYQKRINAVVDHVAKDPLRTHTVEELAAVSNFSKFHFHRIFSAISGETVSAMVSRLRLESAAAALIYKKTTPITEIALDHGFSSSANFSKAFSKYFDCSPSAYRNNEARSDELSKIGKANLDLVLNDVSTNWQVEIVRQVETPLAYIRHIGAYEHQEISEMYRQLRKWIMDHGCGTCPSQAIGITWSDSHIAAEETWRYDACMSVKAGTKGNGRVGIQMLSEGPVAQLALTLPHSHGHDLSTPWNWLLGHWLPTSGNELARHPSYEIYDDALDTDHFSVRLCLPLATQLQESSHARF